MDTAATKSNTFGETNECKCHIGGSRTEEINSFFLSLLAILADLRLLFEVLSRSHIWMIIEHTRTGFAVMAFPHFTTQLKGYETAALVVIQVLFHKSCNSDD